MDREEIIGLSSWQCGDSGVGCVGPNGMLNPHGTQSSV